MANQSSILVALATYNELENLPSLVAAIHEELPEAKLLIVDDNSPDGTGTWCDQFAEEADWFSCHHRPGKLGLGSAILLAMQIACQDNHDLLITLDSDWSHSPKNLPLMVEAAALADVVIGSRYCPGASISGWPLHRRLVSRYVNSLTRNLLGISTRDCSGNFRIYNTPILRKLRWNEFQAPGYSFLEETLWHLHLLGAHCREVPIEFTDRQKGTSKASIREACGKLHTVIRLAFQRFFASEESEIE